MHVCVQVASIVLEWINNHFSDFETDTNLSEFLEQFEALMEKQVCTIMCLAVVYSVYNIIWEPHTSEDE